MTIAAALSQNMGVVLSDELGHVERQAGQPLLLSQVLGINQVLVEDS